MQNTATRGGQLCKTAPTTRSVAVRLAPAQAKPVCTVRMQFPQDARARKRLVAWLRNLAREVETEAPEKYAPTYTARLMGN